MAQRQTVTYVSDLSNKPIEDNDAPTVGFSYDGTDYTIDLTSAEAEKFYKVMQPYLDAATKVGGRKGRGKKASTSTGPSAAELREWGKQNGFDIPDRGRVPSAVRDAYNAAS